MIRWMAILLLAAAHAQAGDDDAALDRASAPCSEAWVTHVEAWLGTGDGRGHGPDPGSEEWRSVVEFRLGLRDDAAVPSRESEAWCHYVDQRLTVGEGVSRETGPSYACDRVAAGSVEAMICQDPALSRLDRRLAAAYATARRMAANERPPRLVAEQRGWIKGRNEAFEAAPGGARIIWGHGAPAMSCQEAALAPAGD